jgi:hypothetical protein
MIKPPIKIKLSKGLLILLFVHMVYLSIAQSPQDTSAASHGQHADDPATFLTRVELFHELRYQGNDIYVNQTVLRTIVKLGKKFTTRLDIPYISSNLQTPQMFDQSGIGDISFRLLGYKVAESRKIAITTSVEVSLNTATSPVLGAGKNMIIPLVSFTKLMPRGRMLFAAVLQQTNSFSGDAERKDLSFTKVQLILLKSWTKKFWSVVAPSTFIDYVDGGISMNFEARTMYAPKPRISFWIQGGIGLFGNFPARYEWAAQAGCRYFLLRDNNGQKR